MKEFKKGEFVQLAVVGLREENDRYYIYLSDGYKETYRVLAYDFQTEWEDNLLPEFMSCYVVNVSIHGLPYLTQSKAEVLHSCFTSRDEYPFKILDFKKDENTNTHFYELKDAFGIYHRLYNTLLKGYEPGDFVDLFVRGIEEKDNNIAHLDLAYVNHELKEKVEVTNPKDGQEENLDPRKESSLGFESNTIEFKSSIVYPAGGIEPDIDKQILIIARTIAGLQNSNGGTLYIGVDDSGNISGIEKDYPYLNESEKDQYTYQPNTDGYENKIRSSIRKLLGNIANSKIDISFDKHEGKDYCIITIHESDYPIYMQGIKIFQRAGNLTQLLKNDEVSYFIEQRFRKRLGDESFTRPVNIEEEKPEDEAVSPAEEKKSSKNNKEFALENIETNPINYKDVWFYVYLFKNGNWCFERNKKEYENLEREIAIPKDVKNGMLVFAYTNGRINIVNTKNLLNRKSKKSRITKNIGKLFKTGWIAEEQLLDVFVAKADDLLYFHATTASGHNYVKLHKISDISVHDINAQGNILINEKIDDAEINQCVRIPLSYYSFISSLVLKSNQTSSSIGFKENDKNLLKTIKLAQKLVEIQKNKVG